MPLIPTVSTAARRLGVAVRSAARGLWSRLPVAIDRRVRVISWLSLASQILIVGTGGAVRLTGSGLGCPTWPRCTEDSFVATPEMGIHGVIEFGNRLLTFLLIVIAIVAFLFVIRQRSERPDLFRLTLLLGLGIPLQAVVGGITVLSNLNPWVVGLHFIPSALLAALAGAFVYRVHRGRPATSAVPGWFRRLMHLASVVIAVTVLVGILTTGSGPHAGDHGAARNGLDPGLLQHLHSWPGYIAFALVVALVVAAVVLRLGRQARYIGAVAAVMLVQIVVGVAQARLGLPELLVGIHMVLAVVLVAAQSAATQSLSHPRSSADGVVDDEPELADATS